MKQTFKYIAAFIAGIVSVFVVVAIMTGLEDAKGVGFGDFRDVTSVYVHE